jgi:hypothetical protein
MYLTRLEETGPHHYGRCPEEDHSICRNRWLESFGKVCSLCGVRFLIYDSLYGAAAVLDQDPFNGALCGRLVAIACVECCPSEYDARRKHDKKSLCKRIFSDLDLKLDNINLLMKVAELNVSNGIDLDDASL